MVDLSYMTVRTGINCHIVVANLWSQVNHKWTTGPKYPWSVLTFQTIFYCYECRATMILINYTQICYAIRMWRACTITKYCWENTQINLMCWYFWQIVFQQPYLVLRLLSNLLKHFLPIRFLFTAASIHTTRGFGGYRTSAFNPGSIFRILGPSIKVAIPLTLLWTIACSFMGLLLLKSIEVIYCWNSNQQCTKDSDWVEDEDLSDLLTLAILESILIALTLFAVFSLLRIDCKYDPDWYQPPSDVQRGGGVSVIGGVGGFSLAPTSTCDRVGRVAWAV